MKKNIRIKSSVVYSICILLILLISYAGLIYYKNYGREYVLKEIEYNSVEDSKYEVYYNENKIISGIPKEEGFIRKYTDHIDLNFNYMLNFSDVVSGSQESLVKAKLIIYAPNSLTKIWESDVDYLIPNKIVEYENTSQYKFNNKVTIDYKKYLNMYEDFKEDTSIVSNAKILVEFVSGSIAEATDIPKIIKTDTITYDIPLSDVTFTINKTTNIDSESKTSKKISDDNNKQKYLYLMFICVLSIIILVYIMVIRYFDDKKRNGYYKNKLNKILKSYDNIIVNIESIPSLKDKKIINVTTFEELLDAQLEIRMPINYCETAKNIESKFIIITNDIAWVYVLKKEGR